MFYAPWDSDSLTARKEFEIVANHFGQEIFFAAINCWWPEGECRKYNAIRRYPHFVAHIRSEGDIEYRHPMLASYFIPFLENIITPLVPVQNEGELLDLRAKHDAVVLGYFDFIQSSHLPGYRHYLTTSIKALINDPWRSVAFTVVTNSKVAKKLKIDTNQEGSLIIFVGNTTERFTAKFSKPFTLLSWIYSRADLSKTIKWLSPSGIKSQLISDYIGQSATLILFTPRSFLFGISPYFDLIRELVLDYYNCDDSPIIRSFIHRNILRRKLVEEQLAELEEKCHELLDRDEHLISDSINKFDDDHSRSKHQSLDTCCHSQVIKWRSFGGVRHGMTKNCLCTACVHISIPKCPARCNHFDCLSTASRYLDEFDPNNVNNSAIYCNQIRHSYQPRYTPYYKIVTSCSGNIQSNDDFGSNSFWNEKHHHQWGSDEKISRMIEEFENQHCRKLKLGMNYTDLNFPESNENRRNNIRTNFTGLACRTNRTLKFMALDSLLYQAFADSLGLDIFNAPHSTIALIVDPQQESIHVLDHQILMETKQSSDSFGSLIHVPRNTYSKDAFIEFIKNYTVGNLPRFLRSEIASSGFCDLNQIIDANQSLSSSSSLSILNRTIICVPELNTETFINLILSKSLNSDDSLFNPNLAKFNEKDVVVMYYAPWCGFCSSIAHIYLDVARLYARSNEIIFARINGGSNDLPWEYTVDRYPTIIFFPALK
ncbi:disulfide isomerase-like protein [Sarcoptes scabiei]|uniref:Disulfide isomerase-like protein n=1 Tax=Sarcoptes scabiei TaxID=52283 RepID=A0A132AKX2_SARSC|nr:disulfide isomerase-like protein [Sarcoptes scabiei]